MISLTGFNSGRFSTTWAVVAGCAQYRTSKNDISTATVEIAAI